MSDLISHPLLEVVLQLEYVISWSKATAHTSNSAPGTPYRNADTKDKVCVHNIHVHIICFVIAFKAQFYMCTTLMFNELGQNSCPLVYVEHVQQGFGSLLNLCV